MSVQPGDMFHALIGDFIFIVVSKRDNGSWSTYNINTGSYGWHPDDVLTNGKYYVRIA